MKRFFAVLLAAALALSLCTGCSSKGSSSGSTSSAEPTPTPTPVYDPDPLTGVEKPDDYKDERVVAIMINNISACRPQRGLNSAKVLFESKVEGGITRFMGLFDDYENLPTVGPVRSGRDQFFRLIVPYQALYVHIGRSGITQTYIDDSDYNEFDVDGRYAKITYFDENRLAQGYKQEHTAYTNAELLTSYLENNDVDMEHTMTSPIFDFVNYDEPARQLEGESALSLGIVHSDSYRTYFDYDTTSNQYKMSMYSSSQGVTPTYDENDGEQVSFDNLFVLFADIEPYYYPGGNLDANGNDKGDPDYQKVDYEFGGYGFYVNGGVIEQIRWFKGATNQVLRFTDMSGDNALKVNTGRSYVAIVDLDEYDNFTYTGADSSVADSAPDADASAAAAEAAAEQTAES
ncbi:MAG: DUF3048 domain-containing protein [Pygmaiobacter massiliensis]|nr:DUF3048 domain-containing protein [Pygmaiobacter massiliensis]